MISFEDPTYASSTRDEYDIIWPDLHPSVDEALTRLAAHMAENPDIMERHARLQAQMDPEDGTGELNTSPPGADWYNERAVFHNSTYGNSGEGPVPLSQADRLYNSVLRTRREDFDDDEADQFFVDQVGEVAGKAVRDRVIRNDFRSLQRVRVILEAASVPAGVLQMAGHISNYLGPPQTRFGQVRRFPPSHGNHWQRASMDMGQNGARHTGTLHSRVIAPLTRFINRVHATRLHDPVLTDMPEDPDEPRTRIRQV